MNKVVTFTLTATLLIVGTFFYFFSRPSVEERLSKVILVEEIEHNEDTNQSDTSLDNPQEETVFFTSEIIPDSNRDDNRDTSTDNSKMNTVTRRTANDDGDHFVSFTNESIDDFSQKSLSEPIGEATIEIPKIVDYSFDNFPGAVVEADSPIVNSPHFQPDPMLEDQYEQYDQNYCNPCSYCNCTRWGTGSWIYLDHVEGHWRDNKEGYTSLGLFMIPPYLHRSLLPFLDLRAHVLNNGRFAANLGGGFRYQPYNSSRIYGLNLYYDSRIASFRNRYEQLGVGLEVLSPCMDLRVNGYIPIGNRVGHSKLCVFDESLGGYEATSQEKQRSMGGFDAELGRWFNSCKFFSLYGAVGVYAYFPKVEKHNAYGCEARVESALYRNLFLELRGSYDRVFHANVQARLTYVIPFSKLFDGLCKESCNECCNCLIYQPVHREEMIVLDKKQCCWTWDWDDSGRSCSHCNK